jgi:predicted flap endonuclease-1-like 5' DNA nuclease
VPIAFNMSAAAMFLIAFLLLVGLTGMFPNLPPGQFLCDTLRVPQLTLSIGGFYMATLSFAITNGLFWGLVATGIYGLFCYVTKREPLRQMPAAPELSTPPPKPMPVDDRVVKIPPSITVREKDARVEEEDVETIEGIGKVRGRLLRNAGIHTVSEFLRVGATRGGRQRIAREVGVSYSVVLKWVYRGDLLRIRGVGRQYSGLLESAGITTVADLSMRNPLALCQRLKVVNKKRNLVRRTPPAKTIEIWVNSAKDLEAIVE